MPDYEPEKKEPPRATSVSRRMEEHIKKGKAARSRFGEHLWLDITQLGEHHIKHNLREVWEICHYFLGVDPVREMIPVRPAHYTMGGVRTKPTGESPTLKGLSPRARRLGHARLQPAGGNSVAETVVAGMIGEYVADFCSSTASGEHPHGLIREFVEREQAKLDAMIRRSGGEDASAIKQQMQEVMSGKVGIFRTGPSWTRRSTPAEAARAQPQHRAACAFARRQPGLVTAYRVQKMLKLAPPSRHGAQVRTESRARALPPDFPRRDDAQWLKRTLATWTSESDTLPTLAYEPIDKAHGASAWRGYGAKDYIDHPDTPGARPKSKR